MSRRGNRRSTAGATDAGPGMRTNSAGAVSLHTAAYTNRTLGAYRTCAAATTLAFAASTVTYATRPSSVCIDTLGCKELLG